MADETDTHADECDACKFLYEPLPSGKTRAEEFDKMRLIFDKVIFTAKVMQALVLIVGAIVIGWASFREAVADILGLEIPKR